MGLKCESVNECELYPPSLCKGSSEEELPVFDWAQLSEKIIDFF